MSFKPKVTCNLDVAIAYFQESFAVDMQKVVKKTQGDLITTFLQLCVPKTKGQGKKAIERDMSKVFVSPSYFANNFVGKGKDAAAETERIQQYFKKNDFAKLQKIQADGGLLQNVKFQPFSKDLIKRDTRGRTHKQSPKILCTEPKKLKEYVKGLIAKVGRLKGSFINSAQHFGGRYPGWIKNNAEGYYVDNTNNVEHCSASSISNVPYGESVNQRTNLLNRVYAIQAAKLLGAVRVGVLNAAISKYYNS
jgi:hypothetical protein